MLGRAVGVRGRAAPTGRQSRAASRFESARSVPTVFAPAHRPLLAPFRPAPAEAVRAGTRCASSRSRRAVASSCRRLRSAARADGRSAVASDRQRSSPAEAALFLLFAAGRPVGALPPPPLPSPAPFHARSHLEHTRADGRFAGRARTDRAPPLFAHRFGQSRCGPAPSAARARQASARGASPGAPLRPARLRVRPLSARSKCLGRRARARRAAGRDRKLAGARERGRGARAGAQGRAREARAGAQTPRDREPGRTGAARHLGSGAAGRAVRLGSRGAGTARPARAAPHRRRHRTAGGSGAQDDRSPGLVWRGPRVRRSPGPGRRRPRGSRPPPGRHPGRTRRPLLLPGAVPTRSARRERTDPGRGFRIL